MPAKDKGVIISGRQVKDGSALRARDVEFELRSVSVPPQVKSLLCRLAEINHANMNRIAELSTMLDQCINIIQSFSDIAGNMKEKMDSIQREVRGEADVGSVSTQD